MSQHTPNAKAETLRQVDVCMIVDTTGSMGPFLDVAKRELLSMVGDLSAASDIDLRMGLVEYRDHPPQERSFITRKYDMTNDLKGLKRSLRKLRPNGGGDGPEAVYQGIYDACVDISWRPHSARFGFLVGDAPPHGFADWYKRRRGQVVDRAGDAWPKGCPSGLDVDSVCAEAERTRMRIYALVMGLWPPATTSFAAIAEGTGGESFTIDGAKQSLQQIKSILQDEFATIDFDQQVWESVQESGQLDADAVAEVLDCPRVKVAASIARMGGRGLWEGFI